MEITNTQNLPEPLVRAVTLDPYERKSDYTVTELVSPPRIVALKRQYEAELTEDASDRIWALMGQLGHLVLERAAYAEDELAEKRWFIERQGVKISGQADLWKKNTLLDYKFTSVYAVKEGVKPEWLGQLNLLACLAGMNGVEVKEAKIIAILRDWSVNEARRDKTYPQAQVKVLDLPLLNPEQQLVYLDMRLRLHLEARTALPDCNSVERWEKPAKFAVMKKGRERALKLFDNEDDAQAFAVQNGAYIEKRPAVQTRCESYCPVSDFCDWWKANKPHP